MKVMILAAGHGKRMLPLTETTPKPLLKVAGHSLIEWQLVKLARAGFSDVVINLHHLGEQIPAALGTGERWGVHIAYSRETELLETAGGIIKALPLLGDEPFVIVNGDVWTDYDFSRLRSALRPEVLAHLVLVLNAEHHPEGDFHLAADGLLDVNGKPRLTYSGISVLHPKLFAGLPAQRLALAPVLREAMAQQLVSGELFSGDWQDIGSPQRLEALECRLLNRAATVT